MTAIAEPPTKVTVERAGGAGTTFTQWHGPSRIANRGYERYITISVTNRVIEGIRPFALDNHLV